MTVGRIGRAQKKATTTPKKGKQRHVVHASTSSKPLLGDRPSEGPPLASFSCLRGCGSGGLFPALSVEEAPLKNLDTPVSRFAAGRVKGRAMPECHEGVGLRRGLLEAGWCFLWVGPKLKVLSGVGQCIHGECYPSQGLGPTAIGTPTHHVLETRLPGFELFPPMSPVNLTSEEVLDIPVLSLLRESICTRVSWVSSRPE